ncbi:MAG: alpha/beta fold hydrolase, partial [Rhodospirillales bacterium]|nr:alpha/beta fold hydrolase [Rhodospirillales bacterium]
WDNPSREEWVASLAAHIAAARGPVVLVAHSLACALVAHWAATHRGDVRCALLVSPSDVDSFAHTPPEVRSFSPMPLAPLPFPSALVASSNDPYVDFRRAAQFAAAWGSRLIDVGRFGHINTDSNLGDWPQGRALLSELLRIHAGLPKSPGYG